MGMEYDPEVLKKIKAAKAAQKRWQTWAIGRKRQGSLLSPAELSKKLGLRK